MTKMACCNVNNTAQCRLGIIILSSLAMLIVEDPTETEMYNSNKGAVPLLSFMSSVKLDSLSCSFTSISFLTNY